MKNIFRDIEENFQTRELVLCFMFTSLFLFLAIIVHTRLSTVEIAIQNRGSYPVHIAYYGFPFEMIGVLAPIGPAEVGWFNASGEGSLRILWGGLSLNFILYFLLAFAIVYLWKKAKLIVAL
jgi:hypothetical protein